MTYFGFINICCVIKFVVFVFDWQTKPNTNESVISNAYKHKKKHQQNQIATKQHFIVKPGNLIPINSYETSIA